MVDVVDLLDDSTDDEAEGQTKQPAVTRPSSSLLRDVVANGYDTTLSATSTRNAEFESSLSNKVSATNDQTTNEDSEDEVVWVPTPSAKTSNPDTNSISKQPTETITSLSSQQKKVIKETRCNIDNDDNSDSDVEVLEVNL